MRVLNPVECTNCGHRDYDANVESYEFTEVEEFSFESYIKMICPKCGQLNCFEYIDSMNIPLRRDELEIGLEVRDREGILGKIEQCEDLHNVHVIYENEIGSGLYCFTEGCDDNCEDSNPLFRVIRRKQST